MEKVKEQGDQEMAGQMPLLNMEDLNGKIDFSTAAANWSPFDWLRKIATIALDIIREREQRDEIVHNCTLDHHQEVVAMDVATTSSKNRKTLSSSSKSSNNITSTTTNGSEMDSERIRVERKKTPSIRRDENGDAELRRAVIIPDRFRLYIETKLEGREIKLMIQKKLFKTDASPAEGRFSIPKNKLLRGVLTEEEEDRFGCGDGGGAVVGMEVKLVDPSLKVWDATLKRWNMPKKSGKVSYIYVLTSPWNDVVRENGLRKGDEVQLWGFRMGCGEPGQLGLALVRVDPPVCSQN